MKAKSKTKSKADLIRAYYFIDGLSPTVIAKLVDCDSAYVRVVARQRVNGERPSEIRYRINRFGSLDGYRAWRRERWHARKHLYNANRKQAYDARKAEAQA
jgi:hypothetical protein